MARKIKLLSTIIFAAFVAIVSSLAFTTFAVCGPDSTWSEWSEQKVTATGDREVQSIKEYRSKTKITTTSSSSSLSGWTKYDSKATGWTNWSAWQNQAVTSSSTREVKTQTVPAVKKTKYVYYRWVAPDGKSAATYKMGNGYTYEEIQLDYQLSCLGTTDNGQVKRYGEYTYGLGGSYLRKIWYYSGTKTVTVSDAYTQYSYRDATYTYYYYKWSDWSDWTATKLTANDTTQVETRTRYRYRYTAHSYGNKEVLKPSTCTEQGMASQTCQYCGKQKRSKLSLKEHNYPADSWKVTKKSTCTTAGVQANACSVCGFKTTKPLKKGSHKYASSWSVEKKATCTADGLKSKSCTVCGAKKTAAITKLGHNYSESWTVDKKATCTASGSKSHHCTRCNAKADVTSITKISHKYVTKITKAAMSTNGRKKSVCSGCGKEKSSSPIYKISSVTLSATSYICDGNVKTPIVTVRNSKGTKLKSGTDYTVSYSSGRKKAGNYRVTVKFIGNYSGAETLSFTINKLGAVKNLKQVRNSSKNIYFTWSAVPGATKYEIQYYNGGWKTQGTTKNTYYGGTLKVKSMKFRIRAVNAGGYGEWKSITCKPM